MEVVDSVDQIKRADFVFLTVKLWDTEQALPYLVPLAEGGAAIISFQNGVQKDEVLLKVLPKPSVMGGVSYISVAIQEPGVIRHFGPIQNLVFGEFDGSRTQRAVNLLSACESAHIGARISNEIEREIWEKFVFLVGLSATTATIRQSIGVIRSNAQTRGFLLDVMRETVNVGRASGVTLAADYADRRLEFCDTLPAEMTASMYQDLHRGNRLELPWLSGAVAELGEQMGIALPRNRAVSDIPRTLRDGPQVGLVKAVSPSRCLRSLRSHELEIDAGVKPFAEANRKFEDAIVGSQDDQVTRGIENG